MPAPAEVELFLSLHPPQAVAEARTLVERRAVRLHLHTTEQINAEVAFEEDMGHLTLRKTGVRWRGEAEVDDPNLAPVALCAAMLEAETATATEVAEAA